jgi:hypothetical protein
MITEFPYFGPAAPRGFFALQPVAGFGVPTIKKHI